MIHGNAILGASHSVSCQTDGCTRMGNVSLFASVYAS